MYATVRQLTELFGEGEVRSLSGRGPSEAIDAAAVEMAIRRASSEVDSYLATRYAVPLAAPVPDVVMMSVADIVRYRMTSGDVGEKSAIGDRYRATLSWLRQLAAGSVSIPCSGVTSEEGAAGVVIDSGRRDWICRA